MLIISLISSSFVTCAIDRALSVRRKAALFCLLYFNLFDFYDKRVRIPLRARSFLRSSMITTGSRSLSGCVEQFLCVAACCIRDFLAGEQTCNFVYAVCSVHRADIGVAAAVPHGFGNAQVMVAHGGNLRQMGNAQRLLLFRNGRQLAADLLSRMAGKRRCRSRQKISIPTSSPAVNTFLSASIIRLSSPPEATLKAAFRLTRIDRNLKCHGVAAVRRTTVPVRTATRIFTLSMSSSLQLAHDFALQLLGSLAALLGEFSGDALCLREMPRYCSRSSSLRSSAFSSVSSSAVIFSRYARISGIVPPYFCFRR